MVLYMQFTALNSYSAAIGAAVRLLMAQHQTTVQTLSQRTSIGRTTLSRSLMGCRPFTADQLHIVARTLGRQASEIVAMAEAIDDAGFSPTPRSAPSTPGHPACSEAESKAANFRHP